MGFEIVREMDGEAGRQSDEVVVVQRNSASAVVCARQNNLLPFIIRSSIHHSYSNSLLSPPSVTLSFPCTSHPQCSLPVSCPPLLQASLKTPI